VLSSKEKRDRVKALSNEVKQFHPFLEALLKAMPLVKSVKYTHGTAEFGADFVVSKSDPSIERDRYVGVIVKSGPITQSHTTELDRQIEECKIVPRLGESGMTDITLNEVWIFGNDTISANAKEKISRKYRGLSIEFFDGSDVADRVDRHAPFLWQDVPSMLGAYLSDLDARLAIEGRSAHLLGGVSEVPHIDLEVAPIEIDEFKKKRKQKSLVVDLQEEIALRSVLIIEGEMGSGKSHLLRQVARQLCSLEAYETRKWVPVHTTYRQMIANYGGDVSACIDAALGSALEDVDADLASVVLLVDGMDEVHSDGDDTAEPLVSLIAKVNSRPRTKLILTTRPRVSSVCKDVAVQKARRLTIRPLTLGKIFQFVKTICIDNNLPSRLIDDVNKSDLFRQLPQNPIAAQLLTRLLLEKRDELPQSLTELYRKSMELMLGRWDEQKGLADLQEYGVSQRVFGQLAAMVMRHRLGVVGIGDVRSVLKEYLIDRNLLIDSERVEERMFDRSGVLVRDEASGTVLFRHRSFAEFLFAQHQADKPDLGPEPHPLKPYWANTYYFWIGIKGDCERELKEILAAPSSNTSERFARIFFAPDYLMAGHLTPYRVARESVFKLLLEAATLYHQVLDKSITTPLSKYSPMQLLWAITYVVKQKYGYRFFKPAIDDAVGEICASAEPRSVQATALFFASVAAKEIGDDTQFEMLLDEFKPAELPFPVMIAVDFEASRLDKNKMTAALKGFTKKVRKTVFETRNGRDKVKALFETPIALPTSREKPETELA
jgi:hypothetical protein